jgi:Arc/MetJ-type ribon-helix-helix transcriptional regulator
MAENQGTSGAFASADGGGMTTGMTSAKIAISLPKDLLGRVRAAVRRGEAASLSAYVSKALEEKIDGDDGLKWLDEMLESTGGGPMTEAEERWVDEVLGLKPPKQPKRKRKPSKK